MPADSVTEVSSRSWGSRLAGSVTGMLIGLLVVVVAIGLLWWNEGRAVKRARALDEGLGQVVSVAPDRVDAANQKRLVHVSGWAATENTLTDPQFGVTGQFLKLRRHVEMYQWQEHSKSETREKLGGGTETVTTYTYDRGWASRRIDSADFKKPEGHDNPSSMPFEQWTATARTVSLGAFRLSSAQVAEINDYRPVNLAEGSTSDDGLRIPSGAQLSGNDIYVGANPQSPEIGDTRIDFDAIDPQTISVVAVQTGDSFMPYQASNGGAVSLLETGALSAKEMFAAAQHRNTLLTWGLRVGGLIAMFIGIRMLFGVLRILAAVVPALGRLVGGAIGLIAGLLALSLSLITVAIAWLVYRPILGIGLLVAAGLLLFGLAFTKKSKAPEPQPAMATHGAPPSPPPPPV